MLDMKIRPSVSGIDVKINPQGDNISSWLRKIYQSRSRFVVDVSLEGTIPDDLISTTYNDELFINPSRTKL